MQNDEAKTPSHNIFSLVSNMKTSRYSFFCCIYKTTAEFELNVLDCSQSLK